MKIYNFSIIVPTYNSENFIQNTLKVLIALKQKHDEIVIVDDCSTDDTLDQIATFGDAVVLIKLIKNAGQHNATRVGLKNAQGQFAITIDDDLPIHSKDIVRLKNACTVNTLVYAQYRSLDKSRIRLWMSSLVNRLAKSSYQLNGMGSSTRGFDLDFYRKNTIPGKGNSYLDHELLQIFTKVSFVKVLATSQTNKSRYSFYKLIRHFIQFIRG